MSDSQIEAYTRDTWNSLFIRLLKIASLTLVSLTIVVGSFLLFDSKFWRYYQYQNKAGFYFEKYNSREHIQDALRKLYPEGSDIQIFKEDMRRAGGEFYSHHPFKPISYMAYVSNDDSWVFRKLWTVEVVYDENMEIESIGANVRYQTLFTDGI